MNLSGKHRFLSFVLCLCLIFSMTAISCTSASALSEKDILDKGNTSRFDSFKLDADQTVTAIIELEGDAMIDRQLAGESENTARRAKARAVSQQKALMNKMDNSFEYDFRYSYSVLMNGLAISTEFENLKEIEKMDGVKGVYIANEYSVPEYEVLPMTEFSADMIGTNTMHTKGYNGDGIVIAVLDTGLLTTHEAFQDYGLIENVTLTKEEVEATNTVYRGKWLSDKVPFSYDYADHDDDVADADEHGTHVSGIALGYTEDPDGAVTFSGQAPAAQLLSMKIFHSGEESGTDSAIYFAALEDAYLLGADIVNMSIGKPGGFTYDAELENAIFGNLYEKLDESGIILSVAAGNEYSMAHNGNSLVEGTVPAEYTDYGAVGSPSTYLNNVSIASVENTNYPVFKIVCGEARFPYTDSSESTTLWIDTFGGKTLKYVVIDNLGAQEDYADISDYVSANEEWIAVVQRGEITFTEKLQFAYEAGAAGMICYNNVPDEDIGMQIDDLMIPAISIRQEYGEALVSNATGKVGSLEVLDEMELTDNVNAGLMSDFSCWGTTSDLQFKPQLTAPGGQIYSAYTTGDDQYAVFQGTSMATPNAAGYFACILEYLRELDPSMSKKDAAELTKKLSYSTADILSDAEDRVYSPRKQGAGLVNADHVLAADALIEEAPFALLDDPQKTGKFEFEFTLTGLSAESNTTYSLESIVLTDNADYDSDYEVWLNTLTSFDLLANDYATVTTEKTVSVVGTASQKINVTVELTDEGKAFLDERFANGIYVEGYVVLKSDNETSDLHASFMGYYGDWCAAPILDICYMDKIIDYNYYAANTEYADGYTYAEYGYSGYDFITGESYVGANEAYLYSSLYGGEVTFLGDSLFDYREYNADTAALATNGADCYHFADSLMVYPMSVRNASHMIMVVSNKETGEVYYVDDTPYATKSYDNDGAYLPACYFLWDGKNTYDETSETFGQYVAHDTQFNVSFYGWLDYDKATEAAFDALEGDYTKLLTSDWDSHNLWSFDAVIDNEAPVVESIRYSETYKKLTVTVSDNNYLQIIQALDPTIDMTATDTDNTLDYNLPTTGKGESCKAMLDLSAMQGDSIILEAMDFATNWPSQELVLDGSKVLVKSYMVNVFDEDGSIKEVDPESIKLSDGTKEYNYGEPLAVGSYDVILDGENTGRKLEIEYFGNNYVEIGTGLQTVTLSLIDYQYRAYVPENATLSLSSSDEGATAEAEFTAAEDEESAGTYYAEVLPGEYQLCINGSETGKFFTVTDNYADNSFTLVYYRLMFNTNTESFIGDRPADEFHFAGENVTVPDAVFENGDSEMLGWSLSKDGSTGIFKAGETFTMPENNAMLYVIWESSLASKFGDVNCDNEIDMKDVTTLQKIIAKLTTYDEQGKSSELNADANHDGRINMQDVTTIQKFIAKLIDKL